MIASCSIAGSGVVIGDGEQFDAQVDGAFAELGRTQIAVGRLGVTMKIDATALRTINFTVFASIVFQCTLEFTT